MDRAEWVDPVAASTVFFRLAAAWAEGLHDLKPKTADGYRWHLESRVLPTFGDNTLRSVTPRPSENGRTNC